MISILVAGFPFAVGGGVDQSAEQAVVQGLGGSPDFGPLPVWTEIEEVGSAF
jgi:hypothetical protein